MENVRKITKMSKVPQKSLLKKHPLKLWLLKWTATDAGSGTTSHTNYTEYCQSVDTCRCILAEIDKQK